MKTVSNSQSEKIRLLNPEWNQNVFKSIIKNLTSQNRALVYKSA